MRIVAPPAYRPRNESEDAIYDNLVIANCSICTRPLKKRTGAMGINTRGTYDCLDCALEEYRKQKANQPETRP